MDINAKEGTRVIYTGNGGYDHDRDTGNTYLQVGKEYTVDYTKPGDSYTAVYLKEITATWSSGYRVYFNSVLFDDVETTDNKAINTAVQDYRKLELIDVEGLATVLSENDWKKTTDHIVTNDLYEQVDDKQKQVRGYWADTYFAIRESYIRLIRSFGK